MDRVSPSFGRPVLASITAGTAAVLGGLMLLGGMGLTMAVLSTRQPLQQFITAGVLMLSGAVNLSFSRSVRRQEGRALAISALATVALMLYLALVLGDLGEPLALHGLYLSLLGGLALRRRVDSAVLYRAG